MVVDHGSYFVTTYNRSRLHEVKEKKKEKEEKENMKQTKRTNQQSQRKKEKRNNTSCSKFNLERQDGNCL